MDATQILLKVSSEVIGAPEEELEIDTPLPELGFDDDDYREVFARSAEEFGTDIEAIINSMPVYRFGRNDTILGSLEKLAAFSPRARDLLSKHTTCIELDTLRSMAQSLEAGRYVKSGIQSDPLHEPASRIAELTKASLFLAVATALPALNAWGPCNPICKDCFAPASVKFAEIAVYSYPAALFLMSLAYIPGLIELFDDRQKQRARDQRAETRR
ncbi:hypothetical protein [Leisingera sp. ANG-Vp]|uniref:hypothetical protein n=1 Tax=Leisingera sp. ANG-Vp TaxID=1577896 RepID=UPI00057D1A26|nr:hypothetical protein [Leisingera sp. ANG-Vp]KIC14467.1 hypothetical protein RA20_20365 [Leisingera sp. ANG-Vp]